MDDESVSPSFRRLIDSWMQQIITDTKHIYIIRIAQNAKQPNTHTTTTTTTTTTPTTATNLLGIDSTMKTTTTPPFEAYYSHVHCHSGSSKAPAATVHLPQTDGSNGIFVQQQQHSATKHQRKNKRVTFNLASPSKAARRYYPNNNNKTKDFAVKVSTDVRLEQLNLRRDSFQKPLQQQIKAPDNSSNKKLIIGHEQSTAAVTHSTKPWNSYVLFPTGARRNRSFSLDSTDSFLSTTDATTESIFHFASKRPRSIHNRTRVPLLEVTIRSDDDNRVKYEEIRLTGIVYSGGGGKHDERSICSDLTDRGDYLDEQQWLAVLFQWADMEQQQQLNNPEFGTFQWQQDKYLDEIVGRLVGIVGGGDNENQQEDCSEFSYFGHQPGDYGVAAPGSTTGM
mmetsp:Transcript_23136/g.38245  ORF Transcript_23136/g.38245 Transcript_23136/m.38245 type:complete len:395 (-) Transcript_23136:155-1339(-)